MQRFFLLQGSYHKPRVFLYKGLFLQAKIFLHQGSFPHAKFFLYQGIFLPHAKIFPLSRNFSTSQDFSFLKEVFLKQRFSLHQETFPHAKVFPSSRRFFSRKDFPFIKDVFHKQRFFEKPMFFLDQGSFLQAKIFTIIKVFLKQSFF